MFRQVDSRTIVVERTEEMPVFADPPEPVRVEPIMLEKAAVLRRLKWSDGDFEAAQAFGFPKAGMRITRGGWGLTLVWADLALDRWASEQRSKAEATLRLVGARA